MSQAKRAIHWFRSDLRLRDNTALAAAAARADEIGFVFVLDDALLKGRWVGPARIRFLHDSLRRLSGDLEERGHRLLLRSGEPSAEIARLLAESGADLLSFNCDPGPYARRRDGRVQDVASRAGTEILARKDRAIFESSEVRTLKGEAYKVYTPFRKAWLARLHEEPLPAVRPLRLPRPLRGPAAGQLPSLASLGADEDGTVIPPAGEAAARRRLQRFLAGPIGAYNEDRDIPGVDGTSRLSPYLRWGSLSPRACVQGALDVMAIEPRHAAGASKWLDELIWRDFYTAILEEHPRVLRQPFRAEYEAVRWDNHAGLFDAWCRGRTGYPFVDAAMRQLAHEGWMHNRARMVVASFLTKDLLIDWRWGEAFFMRRLVDGDPASNNGGWQWSASTGTDAQPYFRIFNPVSQGERFDPEGRYVRRFVPELRNVPQKHLQSPWNAPVPPRDYPPRVVDHADQRRLALRRFESARAEAPKQTRRSA